MRCSACCRDMIPDLLRRCDLCVPYRDCCAQLWTGPSKVNAQEPPTWLQTDAPSGCSRMNFPRSHGRAVQVQNSCCALLRTGCAERRETFATLESCGGNGAQGKLRSSNGTCICDRAHQSKASLRAACIRPPCARRPPCRACLRE